MGFVVVGICATYHTRVWSFDCKGFKVLADKESALEKPVSAAPGPGNIPAALHAREEERSKELYRLEILDTPPEPRFDRITALVADVFDVPISLISFIDRDRQWFKSACGFGGTGTPREEAFCAHAILEPELLVIPDAGQDPRFQHNPQVQGIPHIRFYAGAVLKAENGLPLGTLCLIDTSPRTFDHRQRQQLLQFARIVEAEIKQDISDAQSRVRYQISAHLDPLTGFFNYAEFGNRFQAMRAAEQQPAADHPHWCLAVMVKLPQLEFIRRHYGLDTFQGVLGPVSQILARTLREYGAIFGRHERGSLIAVMPARQLDPEDIARQIQTNLEKDTRIPPVIPTLNIQIGISPDAGNLEETLYQCQVAIEDIADDTGVNVSCFSDQDRIKLKRESQISLSLIDAIKRDELLLNYQPKVEVATGMLVGMEALLRWNHPVMGTVSPLEIVQAARSSDLVVWLDNWVMEAAIWQLSEWSQTGCALRPLSVNLSGDSLQDVNLLSRVRQWLKDYQVDASLLQFEVLESALLTDMEDVIQLLEELVGMGITIALDDFGTEYSSLRYLQRLPIDTLKIDRSFVREIVENQEDAMLAFGIISIAHDLGVKVVAEGVETREQFVILRSFKCDSIQGHVFSRTLTADQMLDLMRQGYRFPDPIRG